MRPYRSLISTADKSAPSHPPPVDRPRPKLQYDQHNLLPHSTMSAKDRYHNAVRNALLKQKWKLTDPLILKFENEDEVRIDLGAERLLIADRGQEKIAVEVKSFLSESALFDYHAALGQFLNYRLVLERLEPERTLYLAVPLTAYEVFFQRPLAKASVRTYQVKLVVYNPIEEEIVLWID